jgi:hypothetical protein
MLDRRRNPRNKNSASTLAQEIPRPSDPSEFGAAPDLALGYLLLEQARKVRIGLCWNGWWYRDAFGKLFAVKAMPTGVER